VFDGFTTERVRTSGPAIHLVRGGHGPPVLLLHGYPQTHVMWHAVAPRLAREFTVVAPDLRGYGDSDRPEADPDHTTYGKRAMARDQVEVMAALGFDRFAVVGHDRGARVAYRLALDHPDRVSRLAVLDIVPTGDTWLRMDHARAHASFHWLLLCQPAGLPERMIGADPEHFLRHLLGRWCGDVTRLSPAAVAEYVRCFRDPAVIRATCEDYRAGATVDLALDTADRGVKRIACPVLALWGDRGGAGLGLDVLAIWREWAADVRGHAVPGGHFLAEEAPEETYASLREFLGGASGAPATGDPLASGRNV
jgi:haloacetate dehalogenase